MSGQSWWVGVFGRWVAPSQRIRTFEYHVNSMLFTCYSHAIHMLFTCYSHAIHMLFTWHHRQRSDTNQSLSNLYWVKIGLAEKDLPLHFILQDLNAKFDIMSVQWIIFTADIAREVITFISFLCVGWFVYALSLAQGHYFMPSSHLGSKYYTQCQWVTGETTSGLSRTDCLHHGGIPMLALP